LKNELKQKRRDYSRTLQHKYGMHSKSIKRKVRDCLLEGLSIHKTPVENLINRMVDIDGLLKLIRLYTYEDAKAWH